MGLFSSNKNSTTNTTQNYNAYDQRQVTDASAGGFIAEGSSLNSGNWDWLTDNSSSTTVVTGADAAQINAQNTQFLAGAAGQLTDGAKAVAGFGVDGIKAMGASATDLFKQSASNSAQAWGHTIDASEATLDRMFGASEKVLTTAAGLASAAMSTYQPADNKASDNMMRVGMAIAAAVACFAIFARKG